MKMAATEAYDHTNSCMDKIMRARHFPEQASREAIDKILAEAEEDLAKAHQWLYAIKEA